MNQPTPTALSRPVRSEQLTGLIGNNLGLQTVTVVIPNWELEARLKVFNDPTNPDDISQRPLDEKHAYGLTQLVVQSAVKAAINARLSRKEMIPAEWQEFVESKLGPQEVATLPPLVGNIRKGLIGVPDYKPGLGNVASVTVPMEAWAQLDGQHRREANSRSRRFFESVLHDRSYPARKESPFDLGKKPAKERVVSKELLAMWREAFQAFQDMTVTVELQVGLLPVGERQMFSDLNGKNKAVDTETIMDFDTANPVVAFSRKLPELSEITADMVSLKDRVTANSFAFLGKTNPKGSGAIDPLLRSSVVDLWDAIAGIAVNDDDTNPLVVTEAVVLKAIGRTYFDLKGDVQVQRKLISNLKSVDFRASNPMWRWHSLSTSEKAVVESHGIKDFDSLHSYLVKADGTEPDRNLGSFDKATGKFTFSAQHNDIYPIIGDMIRWRLGLPKRKKRPGR